MPKLEIENGGSLHFDCTGSGMPILLLHSLGGSGAMWKTTVDALYDQFMVFTLDARGHGNTPAIGEITVDQYARDAVDLIKKLDLRSVRLVGISMGAQAAIHVANTIPDRVEQLVLADTHLGGFGATIADQRMRDTQARISELGVEAFALEYTRSRLLESASEETVENFAALVRQTLPSIYTAQQHSIALQDLVTCARSIKCETLVMVGDQDQSTPIARAEQIYQALPNGKLVVIPCANHLSNLDNPEFFNTHLEIFFSQSHS